MKKRLQTFLFWFILIQPFLDIYWLSRPPLLKFSIPTILRVLGVFIAIILANGVAAVSENQQEGKAVAMRDAEAAKDTTKVMRQGQLQEIHVNDVVVGDIVFLQAGEWGVWE